MKFMKKDSAEGAAVSGVVQHLALSHPEVSFKLLRDGQEVLHTPGDGQLLSAIYAAMGRDFALGLLPISGSGGDVKVEGFVTKPLNGHGSRINQYTSMTQIWDTDKTDDNDGVMLLGTLDEGSLLRPMIQIMNGDVLKMSEDEWKEKINYLKVLIQLLVEKNLGGDNATADLFADAAADAASSDDSALTAEEEVARALAAAQSFDALKARHAAGRSQQSHLLSFHQHQPPIPAA